jgi:hypothetical protein
VRCQCEGAHRAESEHTLQKNCEKLNVFTLSLTVCWLALARLLNHAGRAVDSSAHWNQWNVRGHVTHVTTPGPPLTSALLAVASVSMNRMWTHCAEPWPAPNHNI